MSEDSQQRNQSRGIDVDECIVEDVNPARSISFAPDVKAGEQLTHRGKATVG